MNVYLVGFMGAGKTEVGHRLAELLGSDFFDLDQEIEKREGASIPEIFRTRGEPYFRAREREELQRLSQAQNAVVALGGGAFCSSENRQVTAGSGVSIWLDAPIEVLHERCVADAGLRPLFSGIDEMARLLESRREFYAMADLHIQVGDRTPDELVEEIRVALGAEYH